MARQSAAERAWSAIINILKRGLNTAGHPGIYAGGEFPLGRLTTVCRLKGLIEPRIPALLRSGSVKKT